MVHFNKQIQTCKEIIYSLVREFQNQISD